MLRHVSYFYRLHDEKEKGDMTRIYELDKELGNGRILATVPLQRMIDACSSNGGGEVSIPPGVYITGGLLLKSGVTLHLAKGACLKASGRIDDYPANWYCNRYLNEPHMDRCVIYAQHASDIGITGNGTIDGSMECFPNLNDLARNRPMLIRMVGCNNIRLEGVNLKNAAAWTTAFHRCEQVFARGLNIFNRPHPSGNGDGLDFDGCRTVIVSDCRFDTSDDCICLQNSYAGAVCEYVSISNCIMTGKWAGIRIGLSSVGDIRDVTVSNIVMHDLDCSGLKIQATEGGKLSNMNFSNIVMRNVPRAVFATLNRFPMTLDCPKPVPSTGALCDMNFSNIRLVNEPGLETHGVQGIVVVGEPGNQIRGLKFENIDLVLDGGGRAHTEVEEELMNQRPEFFVYKNGLPSSAIYLNHTNGIRMNRVNIRLHKSDERPYVLTRDSEVEITDIHEG